MTQALCVEGRSLGCSLALKTREQSMLAVVRAIVFAMLLA